MELVNSVSIAPLNMFITLPVMPASLNVKSNLRIVAPQYGRSIDGYPDLPRGTAIISETTRSWIRH